MASKLLMRDLRAIMDNPMSRAEEGLAALSDVVETEEDRQFLAGYREAPAALLHDLNAIEKRTQRDIHNSHVSLRRRWAAEERERSRYVNTQDLPDLE